MRRASALIGLSLLLTSALAIAQKGPESLLPAGFDRPAVRPVARPVEPVAAKATAPALAAPGASALPAGTVSLPANLPSLEKIQAMSPAELAELLGNKTKIDMPAGAARAMKRMGILDQNEGGLSSWSLGKQNASLVRAILAGNNGQLVSRWGHILLRRSLASRLDAPQGMDPAEFVALRASLLLRMGEGDVARALVQDVDVANYSPALTQAALDAYVATADFSGACPMVLHHGGLRKDRQWQVLQGICNAFASGGTRGMAQLDQITPGDGLERIDMLLAQKYAGSAGRAQRAVTIEWDGVKGMTPWRYGLALAVGNVPPSSLLNDAPLALRYIAATAPAAPLDVRALGAGFAGARGILSSAAMVDLYGQIYAAGGTGDLADRATQLQAAYLATSPSDRLLGIKQVWGGGKGPEAYSYRVLTAYAAARLPVDASWSSDSSDLVVSMLSAGLDANALRWGAVVPEGSDGWAMLVLVQPSRSPSISNGLVDKFHDKDRSDNKRKTAFFVAGLAGLGLIPANSAADMAKQYDFTLDRPSRWTQLIDQAAVVGNPTLVSLLAAVGMQGAGWDKMTPRNLFHIVSALNRVGLSAEARMIAAEAVARG